MADVQGAVVEPDVGFDGDAASGEGGVEGEVAPVVVVGVEAFLKEERMGVSRVGCGMECRGLTGTMPRVRSVG